MSSELEQAAPAAVDASGPAALAPAPAAAETKSGPSEADVAGSEPARAPGLFGSTWAIARKELNIYFSTPLAYFLLAGFTLVMGYFFLVDVQRFAEYTRNATAMMQFNPNALDQLNFTDIVFSPLIFNAALIFVFLLPFLTMRLVAEEKRQQSMPLLMTAPVGTTSIVLGKFIGTALVVLFAVVLTFAYPLLLNLVAASGGVEWQTAATAYLGLFLCGSAFVAIGLFISSLTESQIVAGIVTFAALLGLWIFGWASTSGAVTGTMKDIVEFLSVPNHLTNFMKGIVNLGDVTYFVSLIVLGLFLTRASVERTRW